MVEISFDHERLRCPIPTRELERRWSLTRKAMADQDIDALIMQNDNSYLGGYVRYFLDIPCETSYPITVIFPVKEEMTVILHGGSSSKNPPRLPDFAARGIKHRIGRPYFRTANFSHGMDAAVAVKSLKELKAKRVGFVGLGTISAAFYQYVTNELPQIEFKDATDMVDEIKAVKSDDEIIFIRKAVALHDRVMDVIPMLLRPGRYEYEIRSEIQRLLIDNGSEMQWIMVGSAPPGDKTPQFHTFYQNRKIKEGDFFRLMVEASGPGGYYAEMSRTWCLSEPSPELQDAWDVALKGQQYVASLMKPGAIPANIFDQYNEYLINKGYPPEERVFAHGQGYDLVERPVFHPQETMTLAKNMFIAVHPLATNEKAVAFCCDNFLITEDGCELVQTTPQKIFYLTP